eukprot:5913964-Pleurochrysis_carterae.AAC.1
MHGLYHHLRGDPDPTALVLPAPFMARQLTRWRTRLSHNSCTPLLTVATPLSAPLCDPCHVLPTLCLHGCGKSGSAGGGSGPRGLLP